MVLGVRNIIRDTAALKRGETARHRYFGEQSSIGRTVAHLHWIAERRSNNAADIDTVIDSRETIEHGTAGYFTFLNAHFYFIIAI